MPTSSALMPHAVCWKADPRLIWTMVATNAITFLSYLVICLTLFFMVRHTRKVIARDWAFFAVGFALFIVACGTTHLMEVVTTWVPAFWIDATANIITAVLSGCVCVMLIRRARLIGFSINDYAARLKATEQENDRMHDSLLDARKLEDWSRMSTVVAHEINNPLEAIQNILYLIQGSENIDPELAALARTASVEADNVRTISKSTLSFFRQSTKPEITDFRAAAESVRSVLRAVLENKIAHVDIIANGDVTVEALPGEVRQVLLNLTRNACEASPGREAYVTLTFSGKEDGVEAIVADQGTGIPEHVLGKLFEFGASTKGEKGNGMGLWSVKHIVTKHGGTVTVKSAVGRGAQFILWWPRHFQPVEVASKLAAVSA
jgi:signal transduction histidine kinase